LVIGATLMATAAADGTTAASAEAG